MIGRRRSRDDIIIPSTLLRSLFLSSLGLTHLIAFWSYYVQFPGLLSSSGIEPVYRLMPFAARDLHKQWIQPGFIDEDSLCEIFALVGMLVGAVTASGLCQHGLLYCLQTGLYCLLVRVGGTFFSFQWDTLLLETTAITALTYAPWMALRPNPYFPSPSPWPLRLLLFKLMYMSGLVKVQANCPTWLDLTALEFHFATQCLPGPLAWHAHQLHPFLLRLSVAITLSVEIPAALLLVVPNRAMRCTGAGLQILLQLVIILTGSYNFFNILTMALCLPVMEDAISELQTTVNTRMSLFRKILSHFACWLFLGWTFKSMFAIVERDSSISIHLITKREELDQYTNAIVPVVLFAILASSMYRAVVSAARGAYPTLINSTICCLVISMVGLPLTTLTPSLKESGLFGLQKLVTPLYQTYVYPYHLSNGYGLFRRMTGVGQAPNTKGWAGLTPSVVARPEVILEGQWDDDDEWQELSFRWKPGDVHSLPQQVAPHQPRLDWQMWFAALGRLDHNPWLIHLVKKLLDGCEPVMGLLAEPKGRKIRKARAKLYHYDFTRIETEWAKSIPEVEILPSNNRTLWAQLLILKPDKVWHRTLAHDYMPILEPENESLNKYITSHGYQNICVSGEERCQRVDNQWCWVVKTIRETQLYLLIPLLLAGIISTRIRHNQRMPVRPFVRVPVTWEKKNQ